MSARRRVLTRGYRPPVGRENIWGVGFGFKGFPPDNDRALMRFLTAIKGLDYPSHTYKDWIGEILRRLQPEKCIKVFVGRKARPEEIQKDFHVTTVMSDLGFEGLKTDVVEIGQLRPTSSRKVVQSGCSRGNATLPGGTIGKIVTQSGRDVLLSCAHVFVNFDDLNAKDIVQPSSANGGRPPKDLVGRVSSHKALDFNGMWNDIDAAIAFIGSGVTANHQIPDALGPISGGVRDPRTLEYVWKVGAATLDTKGVVTSGAIDIQGIPYPWGYANFRGVYSVDSLVESWPPTRFSAQGDSGSIVVGGQTGDIVGLLFADSPLYQNTLICRSVEVSRQLRISF